FVGKIAQVFVDAMHRAGQHHGRHWSGCLRYREIAVETACAAVNLDGFASHSLFLFLSTRLWPRHSGRKNRPRRMRCYALAAEMAMDGSSSSGSQVWQAGGRENLSTVAKNFFIDARMAFGFFPFTGAPSRLFPLRETSASSLA